MPETNAYIVAARRSALGRVGGLHRTRRIDSLAAPVIAAALADAQLCPTEVEEIVLGNATEGANPARLVALAAGLAETVPATTIDRQCGSGLEAIVTAHRIVRSGESEIVVAGGADSLSTAPWRIMRPRSLYQTPHFMRYEPAMTDSPDEPQPFEASEALARAYGITRAEQDEWALRAHDKAARAREERCFVGEIVPLRANAEEARDESSGGIPDADDIADAVPFLLEGGTLTPANTSAMHDGAAAVVVVSEQVWQRLGRPPALKLRATASLGATPAEEAAAPISATRKLLVRANGALDPHDIGVIELSESSAAQAIAFVRSLDLDPSKINADGGAIVRGHPFGASGAVLVARLFTSLVRRAGAEPSRYGLVSQGAIGGMGLAALFERV
ncbi:MAG: acetyl-CoA C-acyltransferase [Hyphomicrobiaceae bacterium]